MHSYKVLLLIALVLLLKRSGAAPMIKASNSSTLLTNALSDSEQRPGFVERESKSFRANNKATTKQDCEESREFISLWDLIPHEAKIGLRIAEWVLDVELKELLIVRGPTAASDLPRKLMEKVRY